MNTNDSELEQELRRQAAAIRPATPPDLHRKISAALASSDASSRREAPRWAWWAGAGGAVAAILVGLFALKPSSASVDAHTDAAALAQEIQGMHQQVLASLASRSAPAPQADPLNQEASALADSAHSALGFLAYNFIPATSG